MMINALKNVQLVVKEKKTKREKDHFLPIHLAKIKKEAIFW